MIPYRVGALVDSNISEPLVTVSDDNEVFAYFSMDENQILDFVQQYGSLQKTMEQMPEVELMLSNGKVYQYSGKIVLPREAESTTADRLPCLIRSSTLICRLWI